MTGPVPVQRPARAEPVPDFRRTRPVVHARPPVQASLVALQRTAGNAAVARLLRPRGTVQRCGPVPCDCPEETRARAARRLPAPAVKLSASRLAHTDGVTAITAM